MAYKEIDHLCEILQSLGTVSHRALAILNTVERVHGTAKCFYLDSRVCLQGYTLKCTQVDARLSNIEARADD
jgi:hypothetical protein